MTPLIDCTLQLIIFFILTSQIASRALVSLELPRPHQSQAAHQPRHRHRMIVNVVSAADTDPRGDPARASRYEIGGVRLGLDEVGRLESELRRRAGKSSDPRFSLRLRADRRVEYRYILPVIEAASRAGIRKMEITALREGGG